MSLNTNVFETFKYYTPTTLTKILEIDEKFGLWYFDSLDKKGFTGFLERFGKNILLSPVNLAIAAVSITAGVIYDFTLTIFWSLTALFTGFSNEFYFLNAEAHLSSIINAPSTFLNHLVGIIPALFYSCTASQICQALKVLQPVKL